MQREDNQPVSQPVRQSEGGKRTTRRWRGLFPVLVQAHSPHALSLLGTFLYSKPDTHMSYGISDTLTCVHVSLQNSLSLSLFLSNTTLIQNVHMLARQIHRPFQPLVPRVLHVLRQPLQRLVNVRTVKRVEEVVIPQPVFLEFVSHHGLVTPRRARHERLKQFRQHICVSLSLSLSVDDVGPPPLLKSEMVP